MTKNISKIIEEISECAYSCNRNADEIKLLAVTKTQSISTIKDILGQGIKYIAENRVQEAEAKIPVLLGLYEEFHFIGHLQSNKINKLLKLKPVLIHSIDKFSTAEQLDIALKKENSDIDVLIEINTSGEASKNGIKPSECAELIKRMEVLENVHIKGLMTIGSLSENEDSIRRCFSLLRNIFEKEKSISPHKMKYLSMGMSNDFKLAIKEGSNILRLGSILYTTTS